MVKKDFKHIAEKLQKRLIAEGFVIQRYDAISTKSIYLKLDYGMCNSIRISDHAGKKHLNYFFNLRGDIKTIRSEKKEFTRYFYPFNKIEQLVNHVLLHRSSKMQHYGDAYSKAMEQSRLNNQSNSGFWSKAYLVNDPVAEAVRAFTVSPRSDDAELLQRFEAAFTVSQEAIAWTSAE